MIYYTTEDGSVPPSDVPRATPGVDYTPTSGTLNLDPDPPPPEARTVSVALTADGRFERNFARRAFVTVPVLGDAAQEPTERVHLVLRAGGPGGRVDSRADAWLVDDEGGTPVLAPVLGRHVFYNHSAFDGNNTAATAADDAAVAPDKQALLAGLGAATFARVNATDVAAVKRNFTTGSVPITSACDLNRDGKVNALGLATVKGNLTRNLPLFTPPAPAPAGDTPSAGSATELLLEDGGAGSPGPLRI